MNTLFKYRETVCSNKEKQFVFIKGNTLFAIGKRSFISRAYKEKALQINDSQSLIEYSKRDLNPHSRNGQRILSPSCLPFHHSSILKGKRERKTRLELATLTLARYALPTELFPHLENGCKDKQFSRFCQIFFYKSTVLAAGLEPAEPFTCPATLSPQLAWSQN